MSDFLKKMDSETKFYIFNMQNFSQNHFSQQAFFEKHFLVFGKFIPSLCYRLEEWVFFAYLDKFLFQLDLPIQIVKNNNTRLYLKKRMYELLLIIFLHT